MDPLSWEELSRLSPKELDRIDGPTNSYSLLRLFGSPKESVRVTLYRDHHAWCPYCQKVWLWLEWKRVPYRIKKVTMRCYGQKEDWYLRKVPSGMLPALELDNRLITESDEILLALEKTFGPLGSPLESPRSLMYRRLERKLFQAWCIWLCKPSLTNYQDHRRKNQFQEVARQFEKELLTNSDAWLDPVNKNTSNCIPGSCDVIFIPYLERMNASLAYYKGFNLRKEHPAINTWFTALEALDAYRGTQGDFHTHAHDLPPQMGGCWFNSNPKQLEFSKNVDSGDGLDEMETSYCNQKASRDQQPEFVALSRVIKHLENIKKINPLGVTLFDQPLRAALTTMIKGQPCIPSKGSAIGLRYLRDRISVPRDMPLLSARKLRQSLEITAQLDSPVEGPSLNTKNRFDQNPEPFQNSSTNTYK